MNDIIKPVTADGNAGYDAYGQFWIYRYDPRDPGSRIGSIFADLRGKSCLLCGNEWKCQADDLADQFYARNAETHVHKSCYERHLTLLDRIEWVTVMSESGLNELMESFTPIPNRYGGAWNTPWYTVTLKGGNAPVVTFGARKRVDSITINRLTQEQVAFLIKAFEKEDTTKGSDGQDSYTIHAWGHGKSVEYLTQIATMLKTAAVPVREDPGCIISTFKTNKPVAIENAKT